MKDSLIRTRALRHSTARACRHLMIFTVIIAALVLSCATTNTGGSGGSAVSSISGAMGKDWKLVEVQINNRNIDFDRRTLVREGFGEIFTLKIDAENISGVGAPNLYSAPYTASPEDPASVTIAVVRSTLMAAIYHPEKLREHEYFIYIQNTNKWGLSDGRLELRSKTDNGDDVVMFFSL